MILQFYLTECLWIINLIYNFRFLNFIENGASEASVNCFQNKEHFQNSPFFEEVDSKIYNF